MSTPNTTSLHTPNLLPAARHRSHALITSRPPAKRRASGSGLATTGQKAQRTSKTTQKLVLLPSAPQTKPLPTSVSDDIFGYETDAGVIREYKSAGERMTKEQRKRARYKRITAYCIAEGLRMKLLASFLKREHNVTPRVFDEAMYVVSTVLLLFVECLFYNWLIHNFSCRCTTFRYFPAMDRIPMSVPQQHL